MTKLDFRQWVVTEDTPDVLRLEAIKPGGAAWWVYVAAGVLLLATVVMASMSAVKQGHPPVGVFSLVFPLFFVAYGLQQREVRGGRITVDSARRTLTVERAADSIGSAQTLPFSRIERVNLRQRLYGWRMVIVHSGGARIDVTPPDESNLRSLRATAELLAARLGVNASAGR